MEYDLCIIGGGINGCGIARDAAGRGLSVLLCEQYDLANGTSSNSSKLIHGGLRYLEQYQFSLVRESLKEREALIEIAPHLIREMRFVLPYEKHLRPQWLLRSGLFIYDHLARRKQIKGSKRVNLRKTIYGTTLKQQFKTGFIYSDCWVDDARLVITNALSAKSLGADIKTRTRCIAATEQQNHWYVTLQCADRQETVKAKVLINASGPWIEQTIKQVIGKPSRYSAKLVKGSHIVVPQLYQGDHAYILQHTDNRIVFVIPFEENLTLIGTTEELFTADPITAEISAEEIDYLCEITNHYFTDKITAEDVIWHYAGVRPLYDDGSGADLSGSSRGYLLDYHDQPCPLLNIFGGKITTYRQLAEHVLAKLKAIFPTMTASWTAKTPLAGGDLDGNTVEQYGLMLKQRYHWLPDKLRHRYFLQYGSNITTLLDNCRQMSDLGRRFAADLYEQEVCYLINYEWAKTVDDILWRRSKLGLRFDTRAKNELRLFLDNYQT